MSRQTGHIHAHRLGAGPDVVMVHGWGMHGGVWRDFAERLAANHRVTLLDLPGHGRSGLAESRGLDRWADALLAAAPAKAHWLGWSLGALVSLHLAHRHPARFRSLVMMAGSARFAQGHDWPHALESGTLEKFSRDMLVDTHHTLLRFLGLQVWGLEDAKDLMRRLRARVEESEPPEAAALQEGLEILRSSDLRHALAGLRVPLLLLTGGRDRLVPPSAGRAMAEMAAHATQHDIPAAGHVPFLTHPQECERVLEEFWARHEHGG